MSHSPSTFTHKRDPNIATFHCNHWYDFWQRDLPYPSFSFQAPTAPERAVMTTYRNRTGPYLQEGKNPKS